jgi:hypothetical protein
VRDCKGKGTRAEHRSIKVLESLGYRCTRAAASLGVVDIVAVGARDVKLIQVKCGGAYLSGAEREQLRALVVPPVVKVECWRWPDRARAPIVEVLPAGLTAPAFQKGANREWCHLADRTARTE